MPTTRSSRRPTEVLQALETTKRTRKGPNFLSHHLVRPSLSPEIGTVTQSSSSTQHALVPKPTESCLLPRRSYATIGTQTEEVVVLTVAKAAELETAAATESTQKRNREDDNTEDEHRSKRLMFTPQPKPDRTLWMFPSTDSVHVPRTAPAKSLSNRRPRGPIARTPRPRRAQNPDNDYPNIPHIAPIEVDTLRSEPIADTGLVEDNDSEQTTAQDSTPPPARSGLFGSIRGLAATGLQFAKNLSPLRSHAQPQTPARIPQNRSAEQRSTHTEREESQEDAQPSSHERVRTEVNQREDLHKTGDSPSALYDHFHYIKPGSAIANKGFAGKSIPPPRAPTPPDPLEVLKQNNPGMDEGYLRGVVEKRKRRAQMIEAETGMSANPEPPVCAPLFGPDSHYARGTIDPRVFMDKPYLPLLSSTQGDDQSPGKRKFDAVNSTAKSSSRNEGGSGVDDTRSQTAGGVEMSDDNDSDDPFSDTPTAKRQRTMQPATPRSAMKKGGDFSGSIGRGSRSVLFNTNPVSGSRDLRAHYGPAGQYRGSTFADKSPPTNREDSTLSSMDYSDAISPSTKNNTLANATRGYDAMIQLERNLGADVPEIDFTLRDPNNPSWRPTLTNPRPGSFRVPFLDEEDDEEMESVGEQDRTQTDPTTLDRTPAQPSTPRMSHAELPGNPPSTTSSFNTDSITFESTELSADKADLALEKARSRAQKYKPKDSSRLSEVSQAISRSPSPEHGDGYLSTISENPDSTADMTPRSSRSRGSNSNDNIVTGAPAVQPLGAPPQPFVEPSLDNTITGEDGFTDYGREHQYDDWAANLQWDTPQTYEEAGTGSKFIHDLIRKNWNEEDSRRSEAFWHKEFEDMEREMIAAKRQGKVLRLITGMEEDEYSDMTMMDQGPDTIAVM